MNSHCYQCNKVSIISCDPFQDTIKCKSCLHKYFYVWCDEMSEVIVYKNDRMNFDFSNNNSILEKQESKLFQPLPLRNKIKTKKMKK